MSGIGRMCGMHHVECVEHVKHVEHAEWVQHNMWQSTILLRRSSQCETSVMRVRLEGCKRS